MPFDAVLELNECTIGRLNLFHATVERHGHLFLSAYVWRGDEVTFFTQPRDVQDDEREEGAKLNVASREGLTMASS